MLLGKVEQDVNHRLIEDGPRRLRVLSHSHALQFVCEFLRDQEALPVDHAEDEAILAGLE